jgi:hypothetical protein
MKNQRKPIVGIMGPGNPEVKRVTDQAELLGRMIAEKGWTLLTGGRAAGVMDAASKGAANAGGTVIGILPDADRHQMSEFVNVPITTGIGSARNMVNILSADIIIVCGMGLGTASEAALAIKEMKPVIFTCVHKEQITFFENISKQTLLHLDKPKDVVQKVEDFLTDDN